MQETWVWSLGWEDPLEKGMVTHSSILAWRIPWTEKPDGLQAMGSQRVRHNWATNTFTFHTFHTHFRIICSSSVKNCWYFDRTCIESIDWLRKYGHFNNSLILPIQGHCISFHPFVSSSICFISVLQFSEYRSFTSLDRFIPRNFILFDITVNGVVSLISISDSLLLDYRNSTA